MPIQTQSGVKLEYRDHGLKKILGELMQGNVVKLRVGVVGPRAAESTADGRLTNAENAVIQMYGLGGAPPRDFLKKPYENARARVASILRRVPGRVIRGATWEQSLDEAGYELQRISLEAIDKHIKPENAPATVEKKGFNHPLIETNTLSNAISHRLVRSTRDVLEAGSTSGDPESFEIGAG